MKLNRDQIAAVRRETGLKPLPAEVSAETGLAGALGDQTFFVDPKAVYVFESVEAPSGGPQLMGIQLARVQRGDGDSDEVTIHPIGPRAASLIVQLAS